MLKRTLAGLAVLTALSALAGCGNDSTTATDSETGPASSTTSDSATPTGVKCAYPSDGQQPAKKVDAPTTDPTVSGQIPVTIATNIGELKATLDADATPCTVNSFLSLAGQGYFDKTPCHRLVNQGIYVLQCGDPTGTGSGGPGYSFKDELSGTEKYPSGALAMANAGPNTNGSQFFIVYQDSSQGLGSPGAYTVFGQLDAASVADVAKVGAAGTSTGGSDGPPKSPVTISGVTTD